MSLPHNEAKLLAIWHSREVGRLTRRLKPKQGRACNEKHSMLCDRSWGRDIRRVNGLDVVVRSPYYGLICQDCALADIATVLPKRYLEGPNLPHDFKISWVLSDRYMAARQVSKRKAT